MLRQHLSSSLSVCILAGLLVVTCGTWSTQAFDPDTHNENHGEWHWPYIWRYPFWLPRVFGNSGLYQLGAEASWGEEVYPYVRDAIAAVATAQGGSLLRREFRETLELYIQAVETHLPLPDSEAGRQINWDDSSLTYLQKHPVLADANRTAIIDHAQLHFFDQMDLSFNGVAVAPHTILSFNTTLAEIAFAPLVEFANSRIMNTTNDHVIPYCPIPEACDYSGAVAVGWLSACDTACAT